MTNDARLREAVNNLTTMERRVYDAVPLQTAWQISDVCSETMKSGPRVQLHIVGGILDTLRRQKLVKEPTPGLFIRVPIDPPREKITMPEPKTTTKSVSEQLGDAAAALRKTADLLDSVALIVMEELEKVQAEQEKLKTFKAALAALKD